MAVLKPQMEAVAQESKVRQELMRAQPEQIRVDMAQKQRMMQAQADTSAGPDFSTNNAVDSPIIEATATKKSSFKTSTPTETGNTLSMPRRILNALSLTSSSNKMNKAHSRISWEANEERKPTSHPKVKLRPNRNKNSSICL